MKSYMQLIYIDSDGDARQTNMEAMRETDAETWAAFRSYRRFAVDFKDARFLLDYHKANGDLADTVALSIRGFEVVTGQPAKTDAAYRKIDRDYWRKARKEHEARKAA